MFYYYEYFREIGFLFGILFKDKFGGRYAMIDR